MMASPVASIMLKLFAMKAAEGYIQNKYKQVLLFSPAFRVSLIYTFHKEHLHHLTSNYFITLISFTPV